MSKSQLNKASAYKILGIQNPTTLTQTELKDAYRRGAMLHHPDRGGDAEEFLLIKSAFELLSNSPSYGFKWLDIDLADAFNGTSVEAGGKTVIVPAGVTSTELQDILTAEGITDVTVRIKHDIYSLDVDEKTRGDIRCGALVSAIKMITGGWHDFQMIDGSTARARILPGQQANSILKIAGRGYWKSSGETNRSRGDCYVRIIPHIKKMEDYEVSEIAKFQEELMRQF